MIKEQALPTKPTHTGAFTLEPAQRQARAVMRGGGISFLVLAAWWGVAAALFQWGSPITGQIALLVGAVVAQPITWALLKLLGGPAWLPSENPLRGLALANAAIPVVCVLAAMAMATKIPEAFFAAAMVGWAAAALPDATLYGMRIHWLFGGLLILIPVLLWFALPAILPWAGLIGVVMFTLFGPLILRSGNLLPADGSVPSMTQAAELSTSAKPSADTKDAERKDADRKAGSVRNAEAEKNGAGKKAEQKTVATNNDAARNDAAKGSVKDTARKDAGPDARGDAGKGAPKASDLSTPNAGSPDAGAPDAGSLGGQPPRPPRP